MIHKKKPSLKSVVEESTSVVKAIEKAWSRIGKPAEFSIKIFETEQKNFLGMTTKPAKVGVFFQEQVAEQPERRHERPQREERERSERPQREDRERSERPHRNERRESGERSERPARVRPLSKEDGHKQPREQRRETPQSTTAPQWSDDMVQAVRSWIEKTVAILDKNITFTTDVQGYCLKIAFSSALFSDLEKERSFYRIASYLIMQSLRTSSKEGFRGFKIIMAHK